VWEGGGGGDWGGERGKPESSLSVRPCVLCSLHTAVPFSLLSSHTTHTPLVYSLLPLTASLLLPRSMLLLKANVILGFCYGCNAIQMKPRCYCFIPCIYPFSPFSVLSVSTILHVSPCLWDNTETVASTPHHLVWAG
jgi:hypothetical protein